MEHQNLIIDHDNNIHRDNLMKPNHLTGEPTKSRICSPDIVQFRSVRRRTNPLLRSLCKSKSSGLTNSISSRSNAFVSQRPQYDSKIGHCRRHRIRPLLLRRSRRLCSQLGIEQVPLPAFHQKSIDPVKSLLSTPDFEMNQNPHFQEKFLACLGLYRRSQSILMHPRELAGKNYATCVDADDLDCVKMLGDCHSNCASVSTAYLEESPPDISERPENRRGTPMSTLTSNYRHYHHHHHQNSEIGFEELLEDGYMVYPHDLDIIGCRIVQVDEF